MLCYVMLYYVIVCYMISLSLSLTLSLCAFLRPYTASNLQDGLYALCVLPCTLTCSVYNSLHTLKQDKQTSNKQQLFIPSAPLHTLYGGRQRGAEAWRPRGLGFFEEGRRFFEEGGGSSKEGSKEEGFFEEGRRFFEEGGFFEGGFEGGGVIRRREERR